MSDTMGALVPTSFALALLLGSCAAPNQFFEEHFVVVETKKDAWLLRSPAGSNLAMFPRLHGATLESVAPRLDSIVFNQIQGDVRRTGIGSLALTIQPVGGTAQEIFRREVNFGSAERVGDRKYSWLTNDGSSLLLQVGDTLFLFLKNGDSFSRRELRTDVLAASGLGGTVVYLERKNAHKLHWCRLIVKGDLACSAVTLGKEFDGVEVLSSESAIVFRRVDEIGLEDFRLVDGNTGKQRRLELYGEGLVLELIPVPRSSKAVLRIWRGGENFDGTRRSEVALWDWGTSEVTWLAPLPPSQILHRRVREAF